MVCYTPDAYKWVEQSTHLKDGGGNDDGDGDDDETEAEAERNRGRAEEEEKYCKKQNQIICF